MSKLGRERRKRIAITLYIVSCSFLAITVATYALSGDRHALLVGGISTLGIALGATSVLVGGKATLPPGNQRARRDQQPRYPTQLSIRILGKFLAAQW